MVSKRYWYSVLRWTLIISLTVIFTVLFYLSIRKTSVIIGGGFVFILEMLLFAFKMNKSNRQIQNLLLSIENQDTSINFTSSGRDGLDEELTASLNHTINIFHNSLLEYASREQLLLSMIEHTRTGFISIDEHGDFEVMNKEARTLLNCEFTSNMNHLKDSKSGLYTLIKELKPGNETGYKLQTREGAVSITVSSAELKHRDKKFTLISLHNIQNEVDAKELESWQKLIRVMNHEIMNSIAPIISALKTLKPIFLQNKNPVNPSEITREMISDTISGLEIIESMGKGLQNFVSNYRRLTKIPEPILREVDPICWGQSLRQLCMDLIPGEEPPIHVTISEQMCSLRIDKWLLNQVMMNLVLNAWEAPEGEHKKQIWITLGLNDQKKPKIQVINNGLPIPEKIHDQIFVPFFTTKERGNGIGLFISQMIVNAHYGSLSVYTRIDGMTVFEIILQKNS